MILPSSQLLVTLPCITTTLSNVPACLRNCAVKPLQTPHNTIMIPELANFLNAAKR
jgi:hypothetical protein